MDVEIELIDGSKQGHQALEDKRRHKDQEKTIVVLANACAEPKAMVVKETDTVVTQITVR